MKHRKTVKRVLEYIRPYGFKIIEMLILAVITVAFTLYTPILIGRGVDYIVGPGEVWSENFLKFFCSLVLLFWGLLFPSGL